MSSIYESDSIPTERDISAAKQMFGSGKDVNAEKLSHEAARLKRVCARQGEATEEILTCLHGDKMGMQCGMIKEQKAQGKLITEIHGLVTKNATTAVIRKTGDVDSVTKDRVTMIWGGLLLAAFLANALISWFS